MCSHDLLLIAAIDGPLSGTWVLGEGEVIDL